VVSICVLRSIVKMSMDLFLLLPKVLIKILLFGRESPILITNILIGADEVNCNGAYGST
jgi:hypothetical protein